MEKIYYLRLGYDDGAIYERLSDNWVSDIGYFTSFEEAKAKAKIVLMSTFSPPDSEVVETEYGYESDKGKRYGFDTWCSCEVCELKPCSE